MIRTEWLYKPPLGVKKDKIDAEHQQIIKDRARLAERLLKDQELRDLFDTAFHIDSLKLANMTPNAEESWDVYEGRRLALLNSTAGIFTVKKLLVGWQKEATKLATQTKDK